VLWRGLRERRRQRRQGNDEPGSLGDGVGGPGARDSNPDVLSGRIADVDEATEAVAHDGVGPMTVRAAGAPKSEAESRGLLIRRVWIWPGRRPSRTARLRRVPLRERPS